MKAFSVVVPVRNKAPILLDTIGAVSALAREAGAELIVVDDHSGDGGDRILRELARSGDFRLIERRDGRPSASAARNAGLRAAGGSKCLLLDADVSIPAGYLKELVSLEMGQREVLLLPTLASSSSLQIWPFLSSLPADIGFLSDDILAELTQVPTLGDPREKLSLSDLPAPWVFCWTTAVALHTHFALEVGGFDEDLPGKGSEDIEFGLRLAKSGAAFRMPKLPPVLHRPHPRARREEETRDRAHERAILRRHPSIEVEMFVAFDASNANPAVDAVAPLACDRWLGAWPDLGVWDRPMARTLLFAGANRELRKLVAPTVTLDPSFPAATPSELPLLGVALPFEDQSFDLAVIPDLRGFFTESLICRIFQEAARVARRLFYLRLVELPSREVLLGEHQVRHFDRPYWERSNRLSRSYYDWEATPLEPKLQPDVRHVRALSLRAETTRA